MTTKTTTTTSDADKAAAIVAAGIAADAEQGVDVLTILQKGSSAAFGRLLSLLNKAQPPAQPAGDEGASKDEGGEEEEDENEGGEEEDEDENKGGDDEGAGYEDMNLAVYQGPGEEVLVDLTEYLERTMKQVTASVARMNALSAELAGVTALAKASLRRLDILEKAQQQQLELLHATAGAVTEGHQLLAKGVAQQFERLLEVPAPAVNFNRPPQAKRVPVVDAALIGGSRDTERQLLAKAMTLRIITHDQAELFRRERRFSPIDTHSNEIRGKVEALSST